MLAVLAGVLESSAGDALTALLGLHLEVDGEVIVDLNALVAPDVLALDVLAEEAPVDVLLRDLDGADSGKQIEAAAEQTVGGDHVGHRGAVGELITGAGRGEGSLDKDVALLAGGEDIGGQALAQLHAALEGHALDDADLHLAAGDLGSQQLVQDAESLGHDEGADAIAGHHADGDGVELGEVGDFFVSLHAVDAGEVGADELSELFLCGLDLFFLQSSRDVFRHKCSPFQK